MFCSTTNTTYESATITEVLEFLATLHYDEGLSYSAINCARSALSTYLGKGSDQLGIGSHPLVSKLMRGIFNSNPPRPRYNHTWDISIVLTMLRGWTPNSGLTLDKLTYKMVMIMALVTAQRVQSLHKLNLDAMTISNGKITFHMQGLLKQDRPGSSGHTLEFLAYPADTRLCIVTLISRYISVTKSLRGTEKALLISHKKPHHKVTVQTISRWLRVVLDAAGVDTNIFKSHSTRAASTSAARMMEVPMDHILATAGWSNEKTFQRFYNKPVASPDSFAGRILSSAK